LSEGKPHFSFAVGLAAVVAVLVLPGCADDTGKTSEVSIEGHSFTVDADHGYFGEVRSLMKQSAFLPSYVNCTLRHVKKIVGTRNPGADVEDLEQGEESDKIFGLAGEACEAPGRDIVDPKAPDSAFVLVRALKKAKLAEFASESGSIGTENLKCLEDHFNALSKRELAEISNEGVKRVERILATQVASGC
jgi:hypothetical protein